MGSKFVRLAVLLLALTLVAGACSKKSGGGKIPIGSDSANNKGTKDVSGKSTFELELNNEGSTYYFEPTVLKGAAGQPLTLTLKNEGNTVHNFSLVGSEASGVDVQPGKEGSIQVSFPQSGFVEFFCKYHRSQGMAGELTVGS